MNDDYEILEPFKSNEEQQAFDEWRDDNNYCYYDSYERLIHLPTRKLFSFAEVVEKFFKAIAPVNYETKMFSDLSKAITA